MSDEPRRDFEREAERRRTGHVRELLAYLAAHKKWWIAPLVIVLLLIGGLLILSGTAAAPFIYTLF
jgi:hypothetical protein